jgi:hypothetical protein
MLTERQRGDSPLLTERRASAVIRPKTLTARERASCPPC